MSTRPRFLRGGYVPPQTITAAEADALVLTRDAIARARRRCPPPMEHYSLAPRPRWGLVAVALAAALVGFGVLLWGHGALECSR
jgi:hypothetical protein